MTAYTENIQARRFLFYSHDGLGLGDVRRSLGIARELAEFSPGASVLLVTGEEEAESLGVPSRVGILKLPGFQKRDDRAAAGRLPLPRGEVRMLRERLLAATAETFHPRSSSSTGIRSVSAASSARRSRSHAPSERRPCSASPT